MRVADAARADVIFSPNASPPRDERAVLYFQDLYHFYPLTAPGLSVRDRVLNVARALWRRATAPHCMLAVAVSADAARVVQARMSIPVVMIPNGVDVGPCRWTGGVDSVCVMGGVGHRKSEALAVRAWAVVAGEPEARGTQLELLGVEPAQRRASLRRLAASLEVGGRTTISGTLAREAFLERVSAARVAISCSKLESFGLPVAEALAMGAPVLCSAIPAHVELVHRAGAGALFPPGDVEALARLLRATLSGAPPPRLTELPARWSWRDRAREHVDAYGRHRPATPSLNGGARPPAASPA